MKTLADNVLLLHRGRLPADGLDRGDLRRVLSWTADVLGDLGKLHRRGDLHGGVWPGAVRVGPRGAKLDPPGRHPAPVEYRDPDRERLRVKDSRATRAAEPRNDLYGVGATLFALLEGGAPPCGPASPFTRSVPEAVAFVARRAMADGPYRYPDARTMAEDVSWLLRYGRDLEKARPEKLPSFTGGRAPAPPALVPFEVKAARARRVRPIRRLVVFALVVLGLAGVVYELSGGAAANAETREVPAAAGLSGLVSRWRARLDDRLRAAGEELDDVPLLVVADTPVSGDLGWPRHSSGRLAGAVRVFLHENASAEEVQRALLRLTDGDTLPAVLWVTPGPEPRTVEARLYYRSLRFSETVRS